VADKSLINALQNRELYDHDIDEFEVIETHISWVLLTGQYAYKIKKPVNFGFLNFSSLESRRHYCYEELALNQRFAPDIYLDVVSIGGTAKNPRLGVEPVFEYAVKMRQFRQDELLSAIARHGELGAKHCEQIAEVLADFHARARPVGYNNKCGSVQHVLYWVNENFLHIEALIDDNNDISRLKKIKQWTESASRYLSSDMSMRKKHGFVRECHGDLHLGNMAYIDQKIVFFDCIEFSRDLRWIDVLNEVAFVAMDLAERGYDPLSWHFLNGYLQKTGDYASLALYRYYYVYRAIVRAKVALLVTIGVGVSSDKVQEAWLEYRAYIDLSLSQTRKSKPCIILMHGYSGSGKSTIASRLANIVGAIHIRSDVERKRMFNLEANASSYSALNTGIYSGQLLADVYKQLRVLCREVGTVGYVAIIDATFLKSSQRDQFKELAQSMSLPFHIVSVEAPIGVMKQRLRDRMRKESDPSEATEEVLMAQLRNHDDLTDQERQYAKIIDNSDWVSDEQLKKISGAFRQDIAGVLSTKAVADSSA